jgi:hypothetical protein
VRALRCEVRARADAVRGVRARVPQPRLRAGGVLGYASRRDTGHWQQKRSPPRQRGRSVHVGTFLLAAREHGLRWELLSAETPRRSSSRSALCIARGGCEDGKRHGDSIAGDSLERTGWRPFPPHRRRGPEGPRRHTSPCALPRSPDPRDASEASNLPGSTRRAALALDRCSPRSATARTAESEYVKRRRRLAR